MFPTNMSHFIVSLSMLSDIGILYVYLFGCLVMAWNQTIYMLIVCSYSILSYSIYTLLYFISLMIFNHLVINNHSHISDITFTIFWIFVCSSLSIIINIHDLVFLSNVLNFIHDFQNSIIILCLLFTKYMHFAYICYFICYISGLHNHVHKIVIRFLSFIKYTYFMYNNHK